METLQQKLSKYQQVQTLGFAITIFVFGRALLSQLGRVQSEGDEGSNQRLVEEAVYISSCQCTRIDNCLAHSCAPMPHLS